MDKKGKRSYVRIPVSVAMSFNLLSPQEREAVVELLNRGEGDFYEDIASFTKLLMEKHKLSESKEVNPLVLDFLIYIKRRLDELASHIAPEKEAVFKHNTVTLDIGGGGLSFRWDEPLQQGALLDILLHIPLFPKAGIRALGKVVSCDKGEEGYVVRVAFDFIKEDDREDLIKFVFIKQREFLARRCLGKS